MNEYLFGIIIVIVTTLLSIIVSIVRYAIPYLKEKAEGTKMETVLKWVIVFVEAAEQTIVGGSDKKAFVTERLKEELIKKNMSLSDKQVDAMVEAIVNELFSKTDK